MYALQDFHSDWLCNVFFDLPFATSHSCGGYLLSLWFCFDSLSIASIFVLDRIGFLGVRLAFTVSYTAFLYVRLSHPESQSLLDPFQTLAFRPAHPAVHSVTKLFLLMRRRPTITERGQLAVKPLVISTRSFFNCNCCTVFTFGFIAGSLWILWLLLM